MKRLPPWRCALALLLMVSVQALAQAPDRGAAPPFVPSLEPPASAHDSQPGVTAKSQAPLDWRLEIHAPPQVRSLIEANLDLARYASEMAASKANQAAPAAAQAAAGGASEVGGADGQAKPLRLTRGELRRLVSAAPEQVRGLLRTLGYFDPVIKVAFVDAASAIVRLSVEPGETVKIADVQIEFEGEVDVRAEQNDSVAEQTMASVRQRWSLPVGQVFNQDAWTAAKTASLNQLRARGYPTAVWSGTSAHIDPQTRQCHLFLIADSGAAYYFGSLHIEGLQRQTAKSVANMVTFHTGDLYSEEKLARFQVSLQKSGLFDTVAVSLDTTPQQAKAAPVLVKLHEMHLQQATFGVGQSDVTGPRVSVEHVDRRIFNSEWQSKELLQWGQLQKIAQIDLSSHPLPDDHHNLVFAGISQLVADGTTTLSHSLKVGRSQESQDVDKLERTYYLQYIQATVSNSLYRTQASAVLYNYQWVLRSLDNFLLPTKGYAGQLELGAGQSFATTQENGPFVRWYGLGLLYTPLPHQWYATTRLEGGGVLAKSSAGIPDPLLFRAGGEDSVRGYGYRDLGPVSYGINVGGQVLATGSFEVAHPLSARLPAWWGAGFIDVGDAENRLHELAPNWGYGVGLRWRSPVGPLRIDLAYGQQTRRLRMYFSVGVAL